MAVILIGAYAQSPGAIYRVQSDHLDTPRRIEDEQGQTVWHWPYSGFGEQPPQTTPHAPGGFEFNLRHQGQYFDAESRLHDNWHRTYDPQTGRYTSADPIGLNGGWNRFNYVGGNPLSYTDPTGEIAFIPIMIGIGVGYAFDYILEQYKKEHCTCKSTPAGAAGNAAAGGAVGGSGPFASKPRGGIAGGGPSGTATSSFGQMNHAAAQNGWYSTAMRNRITKVFRKVPYAGAALASYEVYDALTCD